MWFRSNPRSRKPSRPRWSVQRSPRRNTAWLRFDALENRSLLSGTVTLAPSDDSPLVGERVTWTATAVDVGATPVYQFSAAPHGGAFHVVRDFSPTNSFDWTPMQEGRYDIQVTVKDGYQATETTSAVAVDEVASRVSGSQAVDHAHRQPARGLVQRPAVLGGDGLRPVRRGERPPGLAEHRRSGRRAGEEHERLRRRHAAEHDLRDAARLQRRHRLGARATSRRGASLRPSTIPAFTVVQPPGPGSDLDQDMVFHQRIRSTPNAPPLIATDLAGQVVWYYDLSQSGFTLTKAGQSLVPGGTLLLNGVDQYTPVPTAPNVLREIDLAGNPVRETNLAAVNAQLAAMGKEVIHAFHHDVQRLPDGNTVALAY